MGLREGGIAVTSKLALRETTTLSPIERMFQHVWGRDPFLVEMAPVFEEGTLALDVSEDEVSVVVRASLPGFSKEDVSVEVHDGVLSINATHREESEETGERYYRKERRVGSLSRRVALPSQVDDTKAKAELKDGVLTLRLPKSEQALPKKISID